VHGWISLHKLPTGKQMKAVWFPKVLASPNSQQNSPKHRHREPLTLGHRSSKGPMFRWKSASEEQEAPNPKDSALRQRKRTTRPKPPGLPEPFGYRQPLVSSFCLNLDTNASEWSKKSGRLPNISKKYVDEPSKSLLPLET